MIRVSKVIIEQYLPYPLHRDYLLSEGEAPPHPICDSYRPNKEHLDHPMINKNSNTIIIHRYHPFHLIQHI